MASSNNKVYNKVLIELNKLYKSVNYGTLYNNLIKCCYETEDEDLRNYINSYCSMIKGIPSLGRRKLFQHCEDAIHNAEPYKTQLLNYCNCVVVSNKPEWQVIAERKGWKPCN